MRRLGIGEVCSLLDIRPHVLRYWEQEVPLLAPQKNLGGRRVYGDREINLLCRLKYLIQERRYTLEGAKLAVLDESAGSRSAEGKALIHGLRKEILDAYAGLESLKDLSAGFIAKTLFPEGQEHLELLWRDFSEEKRRDLTSDLVNLSRRMIDLTASLYAKNLVAEAHLPGRRAAKLEDGEALSEESEAFLRDGRIAAVTLLPEGPREPESLAPRFEALASAIRESSYRSGRLPFWYVFADQERGVAFQAFLRSRKYFNFDPKRLVLVHRPAFPCLDEDSRLLVGEDGRLLTYPSGAGGALLMMKSSLLQRHFADRGISLLWFLPLSSYSRGFPRAALLNAHLRSRPEVSFTCCRTGDGKLATTGVYLMDAEFLKNPETVIDFIPREIRAKCVKSEASPADAIEERTLFLLKSGLWLLLRRAKEALAFLDETKP